MVPVQNLYLLIKLSKKRLIRRKKIKKINDFQKAKPVLAFLFTYVFIMAFVLSFLKPDFMWGQKANPDSSVDGSLNKIVTQNNPEPKVDTKINETQEKNNNTKVTTKPVNQESNNKSANTSTNSATEKK
jgi:hypothetical protein